MSRHSYTAKILPLDRLVRLRADGGVVTVRFAPDAVISTQNTKVRVEHDAGDIGELIAAVSHRGWLIGDFALDESAIDEETEALVRVGTALSPGIEHIAHRHANPAGGVTELHTAILREVSIVREGMIPGAQIVSKWKMPARRAATSRPTPATGSPTRRTVGGYELRPGDVELHLPPGQMVRRPARLTGYTDEYGQRWEFEV